MILVKLIDGHCVHSIGVLTYIIRFNAQQYLKGYIVTFNSQVRTERFINLPKVT